MEGNRRGIALIVTLLGALALFVVVVAIVSSLTLSNRRVSSNKSVELEAQYAAESGANQGLVLLGDLRDLFQSLNVDLSSSGATGAYQFAARLYSFCHGEDPDTLSYTQLRPLYDALRGKTDSGGRPLEYRCTVSKSELEEDLKNKPPEELGRTWYRLFVDYIPPAVYSSKGITDPARFWGEVLNGSSAALGRLLREEGARQVRYRLSTSENYGLIPRGVEVKDGRVRLTFGDPTASNLSLYSIGEVVVNGQVVAQRRVHLGTELASLLSIDIEAPSFAWFALFFDRQPSRNPASMIAFTSDTVIDGPVHTNDYFAFERNATPWFGGPISSAGPVRYGKPVGFYWRNPSRTYINGFESMPPTTDPTHWWEFTHASPDLAIRTDPLGRPLCYNPETQIEEVCTSSVVDRDGNGEPDWPWVYARAVNWKHDVIPMPGKDALDRLRGMGESQGLYLPEERFCNVQEGSTERVPLGAGKPTKCLGKYSRFSISVQLRAEDEKQVIRINAKKVVDWKPIRRTDPHWYPYYTCGGGGGGYRPPGGGSGGGGGGGGIFHYLPKPLKGLALGSLRIPLPSMAWASSNDSACRNLPKPPCPYRPGCRCTLLCNPGNILYQVVLQDEYIELSFTEANQRLQVEAKQGTANFVDIPAADFNGVIYVEPGSFSLLGPGVEGKPAVAEFAQLTVATPYTISIHNDLTYEKPACTKVPHRDTNDQDGDGDTREVVDRCTERDYANAAANLLGIYAGAGIELDPQGPWKTRGHDLTVHGVLMSSNGQIKTSYVQNAQEYGRFNLLGGMIQALFGDIGYRDKSGNMHGYRSALTYDRRMLEGLAPPGFPRFTSGVWRAKLHEAKSGAPGFWRHVSDR